MTISKENHLWWVSSTPFGFAYRSTLQMFAGIYRDFAGKSEYRDFKFTGIACIPAIPVIFEVNQKKVWTFYIHRDLSGSTHVQIGF